mmetsp:Transcript_39013/g.107432  ORF Transcript_39013/g.107432 Transcript_39013/m.107432 type:complete len:558 (-) Transcript_39013:103-1776(-)
MANPNGAADGNMAKRARMSDGVPGIAESLQDLMNTLENASDQFGQALRLPGGFDPDSDLTFGAVTRTCEDKGCSFFTTDPDKPIDEIYVHGSVCSPFSLSEGQPVAVKVQQTPRGKQATGMLWRYVGEVEEGSAVTWGDFEGVVNEGGSVTCPHVVELCKNEAYVDASDIELCGLQAKDRIRFSVQVDDNSRPRVMQPLWKHREGESQSMGGPAMGAPPTGMAAGGPLIGGPPNFEMPMAAAGTIGQPQGLAQQEGKLVHQVVDASATAQALDQLGKMELTFGYVHKSFPDRGYSLVLTDPSNENNTIYVPHTVASPNILSEGQPVAFKVHMNQTGSQAASPMWRLVGEVEEGSAVNWGEFHGQVRGPRLLPNGSGFMQCQQVRDKYGLDAFISSDIASQCGLQPMDVVQFSLAINERGEPQVLAPMWKQCIAPENQQIACDQSSGCGQYEWEGKGDWGGGVSWDGKGCGLGGDWGCAKSDWGGGKGDWGSGKCDWDGGKGDWDGCKGDWGCGAKGKWDDWSVKSTWGKGDWGSPKGFGGKGKDGGVDGAWDVAQMS